MYWLDELLFHSIMLHRIINLIPHILKSLLLFTQLPHDIIHIDIRLLIARLQLNRLHATQISQFILILQHQHHR